jgi:ubiquinone/menaquinone biosynthesis C-methylase UbiE
MHVVGIEPQAKELTSAMEACPSHLRQRVSFLQATALELPFSNGSFDIAVLAWSL